MAHLSFPSLNKLQTPQNPPKTKKVFVFHLTSSISNPMISDATSFCKSPDSNNWTQQLYILSLLRAPASSEQGKPYCFKQVVQKQRKKKGRILTRLKSKQEKQNSFVVEYRNRIIKLLITMVFRTAIFRSFEKVFNLDRKLKHYLFYFHPCH